MFLREFASVQPSVAALQAPRCTFEVNAPLLARVSRDAPSREERMNRTLLIVWCALVVTCSSGQAQTMSAGCAERDLQAIAFIEQRGDAGDLPAATLGELGLMHLQARL